MYEMPLFNADVFQILHKSPSHTHGVVIAKSKKPLFRKGLRFPSRQII